MENKKNHPKKAIRIDVKNKSFEVVEIYTYKDIYQHIGQSCIMFEVAHSFPNADAMYVDEEGLYHECEGGFTIKGWSNPVLGNALVIGTDITNGENKSVLSTIAELKEKIIFVSTNKCKKWVLNFIKLSR
jgi:hypothetical protein